MEELLKINILFIMNQECIEAFETLENKLVKVPILKFPKWLNKFHVHIDASAITLREILTQPGEDNMDHPNAYASQKLNKEERNYLMTEREGIVMILSFS